MASRLICKTLTNHDIFAITEFNNCFIIRPPNLFSYLNHSPTAQGRDLPFFTNKSVVSITHEQNTVCSKTNLDAITHVQPIIYRQLFAGHVVGSCPMKKEGKNASNDNSVSTQCISKKWRKVGCVDPNLCGCLLRIICCDGSETYCDG